MTKVIAYTALLYGLDYLEYAIRSVIDAVDEHHIIYSPIGAHGHRTAIPCPESRDELYAAAERGAGSKLRWHDAGEFAWEGQQRDSVMQYAPDADVILVLDADEVWARETVDGIVKLPADGAPVSRLRMGMIHHWRSFYRAMLHDPALPERVIYPKAQPALSGVFAITHLPPIFHFGYSQRPEIVEYKQHVHGHKGEWRRDVNWFQDRFMANAQQDCHPVGSDYWNPEAVDPFALGLPAWMKQHPYANMEVIE